MSNDLIQILPHTVANQIAAGEVVQRPASMVKELMENAVDAGAHAVSVVVRDGGKSLVQVIDDGCGMAAGDAVVCFARHATSKIRESEDLFALRTFGFRGEALASIASVAEVELRTRREEDEVGTLVTIAGGTEADARTESVSCPKGTQITVRNLFFNTPARRKFLKANPTETKQVITEFQRVALCHPEMAFTLVADDKTLFSLAPGGLRQRIAAVVGRKTGDKLLDVEVDTPIVRIGGYIGLPATAKKSGGEQFFFVNGRYFRSSYLQKAVVNGYNKLLPYGYTPSYYIYIEVDPSRIDVNIHPQKTEIKFEEEQALWQMLASAVGRSLGRHNIVPMLDFDNPTPIDIPVYNPSPRQDADGSGSGIGSGRRMPPPPPAATRDDYNPFRSYDRKEWDTPATTDFGMGGRSGSARAAFEDPEQAPFTEMIPPDLLIPDFGGSNGGSEANGNDTLQGTLPLETTTEVFVDDETIRSAANGMPDDTTARALVFGAGKYIATATADGLVIIDRARARMRILYEEFLQRMENDFSVVGQRDLFPERIELAAADHFLLVEHTAELAAMGFDIRDMGGTTVVVYGLPVEMGESTAPAQAVEELLRQIKEEGVSLRDNHRERLAEAMARSCCAPLFAAGGAGSVTTMEAEALIRKLFSCDEPNYTPDGRPVMSVVSALEAEKRLKR
ncbi:DNA mismatch repair endonuclease MutL [uncultured Rikenella sp.]|uniref:DNA mismatch repair endonuclease MutL n=1 Tax=uncultured Rikenella sp. TaxID=368003 RepID=UPI0026179F2F|nr:DNA mismatch repair endonuclease MutL [uncultured Rikenella sp.]